MLYLECAHFLYRDGALREMSVARRVDITESLDGRLVALEFRRFAEREESDDARFLVFL